MAVTERDFLPAALEILEKPASPVGGLTIWLICGFFTIALAWSIIGKVDVVAIGWGKTVPVGQSKVVQSSESGVVRKINVANGTRVEKGDALIELDSTLNEADITRLSSDLLAAELKVERGAWLLDNLERENYKRFSISSDVSDAERKLQEELALSRISEFRASRLAIAERILEQQAGLRVSEGQLSKLNETLPLLTEQVDALKNLAAEGIASRFQYLEQAERLIAHERDIIIEQDRIKQISASIRALQKQEDQGRSEVRAKLLEELLEAQNSVAAIGQELVKARQANRHMIVHAPVTGVVQQLAVHTIGGVVKSSDQLMVIVPEVRRLQVEMQILNKDIGFVEVGQKVEIKLEAFPFTKYGVIPGKLISIDHDAVQHEKLGLVYPARVSMDHETIKVDNQLFPVSSGMTVTSEIRIGERRLIEFVLAPIFRYKEEGLRER